MAIGTPTTVKTGSAASGTSLALTTLAAVSAGNLIVVSVGVAVTGAISISDTQSNTYIAGPDSGVVSSARVAIFYCLNATALASGDTITVTHPSGAVAAAVDQCNTGFASNAFDQSATGTSSGNTLTTGATGTRAKASQLLVAAFDWTNTARTFSPGSNVAWAALNNPVGPGSGVVLATEYFIASAAGTDAGTGALSGAGSAYAAAIATFEEAPISTFTRTATQTAALSLTSTRSASQTRALLATLTRSATASRALSLTLTRSAAQTAALLATLTRQSSQTAALLATLTRQSSQTVALGSGANTFTRSAAQTATLLATLTRQSSQTVALLATLTRSATQTASLPSTFTRSAAQTVALLATLLRTAGQSVSLPYSGSAIDVALHAAARTLDFRYERYDPNGNLLGSLTTVIAASVAYDALANIKRTAKFSILDDGTLNVLSDRVLPYVRLLLSDGTWNEYPMGLFLLSTPPRLDKGGYVEIDIDAYDLLQLLTDDKVSSRYTVAAATRYTDAVVTVLTSSGLTLQSVTTSTLVLPAVLDWPPGTPKLQIINDLLAAINYTSLWFDATGTAIVAPYVEPDLRSASYTYQDDSLSVVLPTATEQRDLFAIPNEVIATVTEPDQSVLTSTATNTNATSPISTVGRGRTIVQVLTGVLAPDQTTLDAITKRALVDAASVYEEITFETAIMPFHSNLDALQVTYSPLGLNAVYIEHQWSFTLAAGSTMKHTARRAVSVS